MSDTRPPTIDPRAAARWLVRATRPDARAPWLHEEVGRRMAERLPWIRLPVQRWADWEPWNGGMESHARVAAHYPDAKQIQVHVGDPSGYVAIENAAKRWWSPARWRTAAPPWVAAPEAGSVDLVWANMLLHLQPDPAALLADWHRALATDGFVLFSCFGPDTLNTLRALYARLGWPSPSQSFTDLHDWGDLLVAAGFAEPVMDMERVTLTFATPQRLIEELRGLGRNLNPARFGALRGRAWHARLLDALDRELRGAGGELALEFELVYGHAVKPAPRARVQPETSIALDDLRAALRRRQDGPTGNP